MKLNVGKEMSLMRKRILGQYKQIKKKKLWFYERYNNSSIS